MLNRPPGSRVARIIDQRRGQDPAGAAGVEGAQLDPPLRFTLPQQQSGDQEAGQHEEHVDADEAAGEPRQAGMEDEDEQDGDAPQTLQVRTERVGSCSLGGGQGR
jgi:hypothetical protein